MFNGGRVIAYFAVGIVSIVPMIFGRHRLNFQVEAAVSTYLAEISPSSLRGFFVSLQYINVISALMRQTGIMNCVVALGNLWGAGMGRAFATETRRIGWQIPVAVQFIPAVAIFVMVPFCPGECRSAALRVLTSQNPRDTSCQKGEKSKPSRTLIGLDQSMRWNPEPPLPKSRQSRL